MIRDLDIKEFEKGINEEDLKTIKGFNNGHGFAEFVNILKWNYIHNKKNFKFDMSRLQEFATFYIKNYDEVNNITSKSEGVVTFK